MEFHRTDDHRVAVALRGRRRLYASLVLLLQGLIWSDARAAMILVEHTGMIFGSQASSFEVLAPGAGTLTLRLADLVFTSELQSLSADLSTATQLLAGLQGPGTLIWEVGAAGKYFATISGVAGGQFQLGLASFVVEFEPVLAPVPLPAGLWLLLTGIIALRGVARRAGSAIKSSCMTVSLTSVRRHQGAQPGKEVDGQHETSGLHPDYFVGGARRVGS
jgi:hypothetical protein